MIGLSTSLLEDYPGNEIIMRAKDLGFDVLELAFRLKPKQVKDIIKAAPGMNMHIASLHNYVPEPAEMENSVRLSDIDESLRKKAIELTGDTIRLAADIGARAVVLHMGEPRFWDWSTYQHELRQAIFDGLPVDEIGKARQKYIDARAKLPASYLDSMLIGLDSLAGLASDLKIELGIENRYSYGQFPNFEEMGILLQEFLGSTLGYWHDCGHAANNRYCGFAKEMDNLEAFGGRLIGIHLHDAKNWHDHQVPGPDGDIDFTYLKAFIKPETILVLELAKNVSLDSIPSGIAYLKEAGIE